MTRPLIIANHNHAPAANDTVVGDHVQPFMLDVSQLRGRMVRLNSVAQTIASYHNYPVPVTHLLVEALSLTALLAGMLKYDGIFTLQVRGNGPIRLIVCDLTTNGHLRGTVTLDQEALDSFLADKPADMLFAMSELCGEGYLAFTVDQKKSTDRYQGIVPLEGDTLSEAVRHYFTQSEQIKTAFEVAVGQDTNGQWHGAAIMLQQLALEGGHETISAETVVDDWRRTMLLLNTASPAEMLDPGLPVNDVLYRLFHEEGVRVFPPTPIIAKCRCSRKKIAPIIEGLSLEEKQELAEKGKITVICEFCNKHYRFPVEPAEKSPT